MGKQFPFRAVDRGMGNCFFVIVIQCFWLSDMVGFLGLCS